MLKNVKEWLAFLLPHALIIMSGMMMVFFIIDRVNPHIEFMTNEFHKWLACGISLTGIASALILSEYNRKLFVAKLKKKKKAGTRK